jgi:hypothetical protein
MTGKAYNLCFSNRAKMGEIQIDNKIGQQERTHMYIKIKRNSMSNSQHYNFVQT